MHTDDHNDGTTACFALLQPDKASDDSQIIKIKVANVGDSRAMLIHPDGKFEQLSEDHKPANDKERCRIVNARGHVSDNRVNGNLAVSRAFGDSVYKGESLLAPEKQLVIAVPEFKNSVAKEGDLLLVCCDGIFEQLSWDKVAAIVTEKMQAESKSAGDASKVDLALIVNHLIDESVRAGSKDNHTAVLVRVGDGRQYTHEFADRQVYPGPFHQYANDMEFVKAYKRDLQSNGYSFDDLIDKIKESEQNPQDLPPPSATPFQNSAELAAIIQSLRYNN